MNKLFIPSLLFSFMVLLFSCVEDDTNTNIDDIIVDDEDSEEIEDGVSTPTAAFDEFNEDAVTISFDGNDIIIISNALPNHSSPYWSGDNELYIEPIVANEDQMSPGAIQEGSYSLTVSAAPNFATNTTETGLGAIGISVSGVPIFNGSEGPTDVTEGVASGFDWAGGHSGPTGYHYHTEAQDAGETSPLTINDDKLLGIMSDGFLIYGRKCNSIEDYPTDGDDSNGHFSITQHSDEEFYHYHIVNESYLNQYYLLFGFVDLQGSPSTIM